MVTHPKTSTGAVVMDGYNGDMAPPVSLTTCLFLPLWGALVVLVTPRAVKSSYWNKGGGAGGNHWKLKMMCLQLVHQPPLTSATHRCWGSVAVSCVLGWDVSLLAVVAVATDVLLWVVTLKVAWVTAYKKSTFRKKIKRYRTICDGVVSGSGWLFAVAIVEVV